MTRHLGVAILQLVLALLVLAGVWLALPARWLVLDVVGTALAACALCAAVGLVTKRSFGIKLARAVAIVELLVGAAVVSALSLSVAHLWGAYGPVGSGGALLMATIALLVLPYLIALPLLQLVWLREPDGG